MNQETAIQTKLKIPNRTRAMSPVVLDPPIKTNAMTNMIAVKISNAGSTLNNAATNSSTKPQNRDRTREFDIMPAKVVL